MLQGLKLSIQLGVFKTCRLVLLIHGVKCCAEELQHSVQALFLLTVHLVVADLALEEVFLCWAEHARLIYYQEIK